MQHINFSRCLTICAQIVFFSESEKKQCMCVRVELECKQWTIVYDCRTNWQVRTLLYSTMRESAASKSARTLPRWQSAAKNVLSTKKRALAAARGGERKANSAEKLQRRVTWKREHPHQSGAKSVARIPNLCKYANMAQKSWKMLQTQREQRLRHCALDFAQRAVFKWAGCQ